MLLYPATLAGSETVTVAAGAGYKKLVVDLARAYEVRGHGETNLIFGNMGQVTGQAKAAGIVDLIVGDKRFLSESGLDFLELFQIGRGRLVLATSQGLAIKHPRELADPRFARIGMPDPKRAVYGRAATEFLDRSGLAKKVERRLIVVAAVPQVTSYLVSGEVDAGFINLTDALSARERLGSMLLIEEGLHDTISIVAGLLREAPAPEAAESFLGFLATESAQGIAGEHGL
jgi:molybdate transport system substrate-binding protein